MRDRPLWIGRDRARITRHASRITTEERKALGLDTLGGRAHVRRVRILALLSVGLAAGGCAHFHTQPIVLSLQGLDCAECAPDFLPSVERQAGVRRARFDRVRVELTIDAAADFDEAAAIAAIEKAGFHATPGKGHGSYLEGVKYPDGADVKILVTDGADVPELASLLVPTKVTVIDFFAPWCGPCREVDNHLAMVLAGRTDLAVRKLDVVDWDSPLARHYMAKLPALPVQIVFARDGHKVATLSGLDLAALDRAIADGSR